MTRPAWKHVTRYRVPGGSGWRHIAECTRCQDTHGFSHPDDHKMAEPHDKEKCDANLRERVVFNVMDE